MVGERGGVGGARVDWVRCERRDGLMWGVAA